MTTRAPWSMLKSGELPTKFWVVTITKPNDEGEQRLNDVRAYVTEAGAKYFYNHTLRTMDEVRGYRYNNHYYDGAVVTLTEYQADEGTVLNTFTNTNEETE